LISASSATRDKGFLLTRRGNAVKEPKRIRRKITPALSLSLRKSVRSFYASASRKRKESEVSEVSEEV
jgi:hypothetical protein